MKDKRLYAVTIDLQILTSYEDEVHAELKQLFRPARPFKIIMVEFRQTEKID